MGGERERERERERKGERDRQTDRDKGRERERESQTDRQTNTVLHRGWRSNRTGCPEASKSLGHNVLNLGKQ